MPPRVPSAPCLRRLLPLARPQRISVPLITRRTAVFDTKIPPLSGPEDRLERLKQAGINELYPQYERPSEAAPVVRIGTFISKFHGVQKNQRLEEDTVTVNGRVTNVRALSNALWFYDIEEDGHRLQVTANKRLVKGGPDFVDFKKAHKYIRKGDVISVVGNPGRSNTGELSIFTIAPPKLLSPCLHDVPQVIPAAKALHNRHLELRTNPLAIKTLRLRSHIIQSLRQFLLMHNFIEVETPIISSHASGALANPFLTTCTTFGDRPLALRIAPELWLKRLVVGGLDRVFEIGPQFRNEHIDGTHNPEFTTCEFYRTYADLDHLMIFTEELFQTLSIRVSKAKLQGNDCHGLPDTDVDFMQPFQQISFIPKLEELMGEPLPDVDPTRPDADVITDLLALFTKHSIPVPPNPTPAKLLDKLAGRFLEPLCTGPTFITHHPERLSPLSKSAVVNGRRVAMRAELFVNGQELVNCYEEENSPIEQRRKFLAQQLSKPNAAPTDSAAVVPAVPGSSEPNTTGSEEEMPVDEAYVKALEYGLPPTIGWGCGIDRIAMLFSGQKRISAVLAFGGLRGAVNQGHEDPEAMSEEEATIEVNLARLEREREKRELEEGVETKS